MRRASLVLFAAASAIACDSRESSLGGLAVMWTDDATLVVRGVGGRELLRSAAPFVESRRAEAAWETQFGSYRVTEDEAPWAAIDALETTSNDGSTAVLALRAGGADAGTLTLTSPGAGVLQLELAAPPGRNRVRARFACGATDRFLGFGAQADDVDHRGHRLHSWTSEPGIGKTDRDEIADGDLWMLVGTRHASSYPLPTFLSNRGFAFLADTTRRATFDLCQEDAQSWAVEAWDSRVVLKVFDGPAPAKAIERLTADIGRQPLANDLAFAPWNDAIFGADEVRRIAKLLRDSKIPSGLLWTEDFRGGEFEGENYRLLEEWDTDPRLYPNVRGLSDELHRMGFRFLAYHNTFLTSDTRVIEAARAKDVLVKRADGSEYLFTGVKFTPTALVDLTHPQGGAFVQAALERLVDDGFDGWMADYGEWLPPDAALADGTSAEAFHNEYTRRYHELSSRALAKHRDPNASVAFARAGTLRTAPFQQVVWAGDQFTDFSTDDGLPTVVTMGLNLGLAGIAIYGHDIAGYQNLNRPPSTKEAFFRWTTVGALSPVMRTHHGTKAKTNWWFGKDEETIAHFRRWSTFHARLWPYFRAAAKEAHETGLPIMRQMALAFPDDAASWTLKDQYLLGPSLLVAPVLVEGATSRTVHLPPGRWLPFESGAALEGAREATIEVPITEAGLFARPGTIVPLLPDAFDTLMPADPPLRDLDDVRNERTLVVFGGASGRWVDLDGTVFQVESGDGSAPTSVLAGGTPLAPCEGAMTRCFAHDAAARSVVIRGEALAEVELRAGTDRVARIATQGALVVRAITYRY